MDYLIVYRRAEEVVERCLHQGEDAEAQGDGDDQHPGHLQGLSLLRLDFTQECLKEGVTSLYLESWGGVVLVVICNMPLCHEILFYLCTREAQA